MPCSAVSICFGIIIFVLLCAIVFLCIPEYNPVALKIISDNDLSDGGIITRSAGWRTATGNHDIDLVITWAGMNNDPARIKQRQDFDPNREISTNRYADHGELLIGIQHVINSPWLRTIHVVMPHVCARPTDDRMISAAGEDWQDKVVFVSDKTILPETAYPSFSSHPVEANLHRIPNLSERFVYACDDEWIIGDCGEDTFFDKENRAIGLYSSQLYWTHNVSHIHRHACNNTFKIAPA